ncbi:MAG: LCP family protein, partial [Clostridia bacterium]|nr:LCP family protein [Clostridia bacterium]
MTYKKSSDELRKRPIRRNKSRKNVKNNEFKNTGVNNEIFSHSKDKSFDLSEMGNRAKTKKSKKMLVLSNTLLSILLVISTLVFSVTSIIDSTVFQSKVIDEKEKGDFEDIMVSPNANVAYFLVCGVDLSENLTDIIMVVCYDLANNEASILQIPRDTYVGDVPSGKINAVFGNPREGESKIKALIRCINSKFGLPIDNYATVTVRGTEKVIDAIGGLDIELDRDFKLVDDSRSPEQVQYFNKGKVHLDGQWATALIRNRKNTDGGSDMGRLKNQRSIYAALLKQLTEVSLSEMLSIATNCMNEISTDMPGGIALGYAKEVNSLKLDSVKIMT